MSPMTRYRRRKEAGQVRERMQHPFNEAIFDTWSDEMAWLLGVIWSDGCLFSTTVEISSKDLQLIELVMAVIGGGTYRLKNGGKHLRVYFSSVHTAARLRELGLIEHKSLTVRWPDVPVAYEGAFVRGLIDGDGSVLAGSSRPGQQVPDLTVQLVTASPMLRDGFAAWCQRVGVRAPVGVRVYPDHPAWAPLWRFMVREQDSLRTLHALLYPDEGVPCLHRKRIPFDEWIATPRARPGRP